jgi:transposase InsO family protein
MTTWNSIRTPEAFNRWTKELKLSKSAIALIRSVRTSPPARRVQGQRSVRGKYPSFKVRQTIQFESHTCELPAIIEFERDADVIEYYDQPGSFTLRYKGASGRNQGHTHTPDFLVLRQGRVEWVECKTEEDLAKLSEESPNRYVRERDGSWRCPPGEAYAAKFAFGYRVRSSFENDSILTRNLTILGDYFDQNCPVPPKPLVDQTLSLIREHQGITAAELLASIRDLTVDEFHAMIAQARVYVDLSAWLIIERKGVRVFSDFETARSAAFVASASPVAPIAGALPVTVETGARVLFRDAPFTLGEILDQSVQLFGDDGAHRSINRCHFERMVLDGTIRGLPAPDAQKNALLVAIQAAGPEGLKIANHRYNAIASIVCPSSGNPPRRRSPERSIRRWVTAYRAAVATHGCGFIGLLPRIHNRGNRSLRLPPAVSALMEKVISDDYERNTAPSISHAFGVLMNKCEEAGLCVPSPRTFRRYLRHRPRYEQIRKRSGRRAAYQNKRRYLSDMTLPVHGDLPWDIAHIDHTQLDIELRCSRTGKNLGRPWFTILIDACSRRLLAFSVSFDAPSSIACMMVLRACVKRHHRLPRGIVIDNGKEFGGVYFEALLARFGVIKKSRPPAEPRFGSVCERMFGTANTQLVHNLLGNTKLTKKVRLVTKSFDPKNLAVWTLESITEVLAEYCFDLYETNDHPALGESPRSAFDRGMETGGRRSHMIVPFDRAFQILTLPSTSSGVARIHDRTGFRLNYLDYWHESFLDPKVAGTTVPIRYDPWNAGIAYAFVDDGWVCCKSSYFTLFDGRTVAEITAASEELRKEKKDHASNRTVTAKRVAQFMKTVGERESSLLLAYQQKAGKAAAAIATGETPASGAGEDANTIPFPKPPEPAEAAAPDEPPARPAPRKVTPIAMVFPKSKS